MEEKTAPAAAPAAQSVSDPAAASAANPTKIQPLADIFDAALGKSAHESKPAAAAAAVAPANKETPPIFGKKPAATVEPAKGADDLPDELPPETPEPTKVNWKKAREVERKLRTDLTAKAKELEDFRAQAAVTRQAAPAEAAELERLKTEHQALLDRVAVIDLQSHPDFKRQYVTPKQEAIKAAKEVLEYNGQDKADLDGLLSLPLKEFNAKVAEATKELNSMDATTVQTSLRSAYTLNNAGKQALSKAGELGQQLVQADAAKAKQTFEKVWEKIDVAKEVLVPVDAPDDATPEEKQAFEARNQALVQLRATAERNAFGRIDHEGAAVLAAKAAVSDFFLGHEVPRIAAAYNRMAARALAAENELAAIKQSRSPGAVVTPAGATAGQGGKPKSEEAIWTDAIGR
jgi:hypothetical protein